MLTFKIYRLLMAFACISSHLISSSLYAHRQMPLECRRNWYEKETNNPMNYTKFTSTTFICLFVIHKFSAAYLAKEEKTPSALNLLNRWMDQKAAQIKTVACRINRIDHETESVGINCGCDLHACKQNRKQPKRAPFQSNNKKKNVLKTGKKKLSQQE